MDSSKSWTNIQDPGKDREKEKKKDRTERNSHTNEIKRIRDL